jgi:hypothetical protein
MPYDPELDRYLERRERFRARVKHELVQFLGCLIASAAVGLAVFTVLTVLFYAAKGIAK